MQKKEPAIESDVHDQREQSTSQPQLLHREQQHIATISTDNLHHRNLRACPHLAHLSVPLWRNDDLSNLPFILRAANVATFQFCGL